MNSKAKELAIHDKDTGSSEIQIALLTEKIETLTFPRRSYIDVRAAQRASKLTRPVLPSPESPANRSLENSLDNRSSTRASSGTRSC